MSKKWNKTDLDLCFKYIKDGKTYKEIGLLLNRTSRSIKEKLSKNNLKFTDFKIDTKNETKICLSCGKEFKCFKSENRKFCCRGCSATYNNKLKGKKNKCLFCGNEISSRKQYCDIKCHHKYNKKITYEKIEYGDISFDHRMYKNYLIDKYGEKCMKCGWNERNETSGKIPIELEHIDGNSENNLLSNLKLLCPNCHSLTPTYKALNIGNGRHKRMIRYNEGKSY